MLRQVRLSNFKCFARLHLELAPLTLLCGGNGAGKSSVLQALLALRRSRAAGALDRGNPVLADELTGLGTGRRVLHEFAEDDAIEFGLVDDRAAEPLRITFDYDRETDELRVRGAGALALGPWEALPPFAALHHLAAERIGPGKIRDPPDTGARRSDESASNFPTAHRNDSLTAADPRRGEADTDRYGDVLDYWLRQIMPIASRRTGRIRAAEAPTGGARRYRAADAGFGLSYVAPTVAALLAPPGTLCLIENPEAHLHPSAQTKIAELAARAAAAGLQVVLETHGNHVLDGVRIAVLDGLLRPGDTQFHYFEQENGQSVVRTPQIDSRGRLSSWPEGFFDQHLLNLTRLLAPKA